MEECRSIHLGSRRGIAEDILVCREGDLVATCIEAVNNSSKRRYTECISIPAEIASSIATVAYEAARAGESYTYKAGYKLHAFKVARHDVAVCVEHRGSRNCIIVPVAKLDELLDALLEARRTQYIR